MRILVAEDQPELRRMLVKNLTAAGYTVDGVPDGEEALAYLDAADYDVAVLDIMMPKVCLLYTSSCPAPCCTP